MIDLRNNCIRCGLALPPVYVTTRDFGCLESLARFRLRARHTGAALLAAELGRTPARSPDERPERDGDGRKVVPFRPPPKPETPEPEDDPGPHTA